MKEFYATVPSTETGSAGKDTFTIVDSQLTFVIRCNACKFAQSKEGKIMQAAICLLPVVPVRKEPSHRSEMVNQLLFGEFVYLGEEKDDFIQTTGLDDGYEGWVQTSQLTIVETILETSTYVGNAIEPVLINGWSKPISIGSPVYKPGEELRFGQTVVQYLPGENKYRNSEVGAGKEADLINNIYPAYLYTPYLWGGKSVFGIDCSGFAQQVFKLLGIKLLRDAYQQAEQGKEVETIAAAKPGDLAFFQNEKGRVTHVGILLSANEIVHASGRVRVDTIDGEGILNRESGKRTHHIHSIRRFF